MSNLPAGDRRNVSSGKRPGAHRALARRDETDRAFTVIGSAHLVFGAVGLTAACVGLLFNAHTPLLLAVLIARVVFELATCYAGLLIRDGQRRGALIASATGVVRAGLLVFSGAWGLTLALSVVLVGAAVWLLPMLSRSEAKQTPA